MHTHNTTTHNGVSRARKSQEILPKFDRKDNYFKNSIVTALFHYFNETKLTGEAFSQKGHDYLKNFERKNDWHNQQKEKEHDSNTWALLWHICATPETKLWAT